MTSGVCKDAQVLQNGTTTSKMYPLLGPETSTLNLIPCWMTTISFGWTFNNPNSVLTCSSPCWGTSKRYKKIRSQTFSNVTVYHTTRQYKTCQNFKKCNTYEKISVGVVKSFAGHVGVARINMHHDAIARPRVSGSAHRR